MTRSIFYPVKVGGVFNDKYQITGKIGYGASSTVWLSKDIRGGYVVANIKLVYCINSYRWCWQPTRYAALKICNNDHVDVAFASHELRVSEHIAKVNPSTSWPEICAQTVVDSFEAIGPYGNHMCLI